MRTKTNRLAVLGLLVAYFLFSFQINASSASAYTASITTNDSISFDISPSGDGTSIYSESINVQSDCRAGYNLTIATPNGSDLYKYDNGTQAGTASFTAVDGTSALNSSSNTNKWGYTLTTNPTSSTIFSPLSSTESVLKTPSQTASSSSDINDTFNINYGVKIDSTITPGNYQMASQGAIVYYLTTDPSCTLYSVQYQANSADNPNGMGITDSSTGEKSVRQINIDEDTKITLLASNFKKAGYGFLGWSTDSDAYTHFTDNDNTNDPIIYGPMEDITIDSTIIATANNRNQINMYAVWVPALKDGNNNIVYFQDWDNSATALPNDGCSALTQTTFDNSITDEKGKITINKNSFTALTDKRDNQVYAVARLADGNCWMIENLRLEHEGTVGNNINDSNVTNRSLSQGYGGTTGTYSNFIGLADPESTGFAYSANSNSMYKSSDVLPIDTYDGNGTLEDIGSTNFPQYRFPRYNSNNTISLVDSTTYTQDYINASSPSDSGTFSGANLYSYGNYYTWAAAVANTSFYNNPTLSEAIGTSICPSNWHLPSSNGTDKEFGLLSQSYGGTGGDQDGVTNGGDIMSNRFRVFPNNFLYSGYYNDSSANIRGSGGCYGSRTSQAGNASVYLKLAPTHLIPSNLNHTKSYGFNVRCLVEPTSIEITLDSNNGTNAISRVYGTARSTVRLPSSANPSASIAVRGYAFKNWNTTPDGSGTTYTSSYVIPVGSTGITLYAQWVPQYTITYVNNCQTFARTNSSCTQAVSDSTGAQKINLANDPSTGTETDTLGAYNYNFWTLTGWKIAGWTTNADGTGTEYGVSSTYTVPAGSSVGSGITLYAHWVPIYTVQYDGNGSDNDATGMGSTNATTGIKSVAHTNVGEGDTFDLFASNFKKAGYGFVGWSTDQNAWTKLTDDDTSNDAKIWGPNEVFTAPAYNGTPITTLYAVWAPAETSGGNPVYLQGWTGCSAMTATTYDSTNGTLTVAKNSITALTDERDGNVYAIAKLADGNCWMMENLRLDNTPELSTANTNIDSNNSALPITNVYGGTTSNHLSATSSSWCTTHSAACDDQSILNTTNTVANITPSQTQSITSANAHANFNNTIYAYGNYYNWYSATAGYGTYSRADSTPTDGDLCPTGWKLPYGNTGTSGTNLGGTKGGFSYLDKQMGGTGTTQSTSVASNKWRMFPNNFIYSGYWKGSSAGSRGNYGYYWSSSAYANTNSYSLALSFYNTDVGPGNYGFYKYNGYSVRCISAQ